MATRTHLLALLNGIPQMVDLTADDLVVLSITLGGSGGTNLTKAILDSLIANSHASGSDNQNIVAGDGLDGGGSGATVTLDVDSSVIRTSGANAFAADQSMGGNKLTNLAAPTADSDAATKGYVDSVSAGLDPKQSVRAATTAALPAVTYDNGTGGVGATLTADANGALPDQDGITLVVSDRLLVKDQAAALQNGIYVVTQVGDGSNPFILTRAEDQDGSPANEVSGGNFTFVEQGSTQEGSGWVVVADGDLTVGTDAITWTQFSDAGSAVTSVFGRSGAVTAQAGDYTASQITNVPAGGIAAVTVQAAIDELDSEKFNSADFDSSFDTRLATKDTDDLAEGSNLYFTDERAQDAVGGILQDSDTVDLTYDDAGGSISAEVLAAPLVKRSMIAGESFAADTTFLVRMALDGETAGRIYKATNASALSTKGYYAFGILSVGGSSLSAGDPGVVTLLGTVTLGSSDTPFNAADIGLPVYLTTGGGFSITAPTASGTAVWRVGMVQETDKILVGGQQLNGVN